MTDVQSFLNSGVKMSQSRYQQFPFWERFGKGLIETTPVVVASCMQYQSIKLIQHYSFHKRTQFCKRTNRRVNKTVTQGSSCTNLDKTLNFYT